jgi:hypothetical protein
MKLLRNNLALRSRKLAAWCRLCGRPAPTPLLSAFLCGVFLLAIGCRPTHESHGPSILFTQVPPAARGGPELLDRIKGRVENGQPGTGIVVYSRSKGTWYIQPFRSHAFTKIESDGSWNNVSHLGSDYAALLVAPGYQPPAKVSALPPVNDSVLAVASTRGSSGHLPEPKILHFGGYDWKIRSSFGDLGGELCDYEASNVWVDDRGYLHLFMEQHEGQWQCAGISLSRSLGYGTYRFVVSDSAHLPPSAVLAMFTRSEHEDTDDRTGLAIQLSQWGKPHALNANYVVQPYYSPGNTTQLQVPEGPMTYVLRWQPGMATFRAYPGASAAPRGKVVEHVFKSGIPIPATETVRLDFYDFHHSQSGMQHPVEIVVQKFEYLP